MRGNSSTSFYPYWVAGIQLNQTYDVRVRAMVSGIWGNYASVCQITTPASPPGTKVRTADCGISLSSMTQIIYCDAVAGAQDYQWEFVHSTSGFSQTYTRGAYLTTLRPSWIVGIQNNKTYDVRVRAKVGEVWGSFNTVCQISTPVARLGQFNEDLAGDVAELMYEQEKFNVYPNPGNGNFYLSIPSQNNNEEINVEMFDVYGKLVYSYGTDKLMPGELIIIDGENKFAKGVYFIRANYGEMVELRKVLVQ